jgi:hypothetical protein
MDLIDEQYINLLSPKLDKLVKKSSKVYNCRCPLCGDSQRNKTKARGYFYQVKNNTNYKCHNCSIVLSFDKFLRQFDPSLYSQYCLDKYSSKQFIKTPKTETPILSLGEPVFREKIDLPRADENHISSTYLKNRRIDPKLFYFAEKFKLWVNTIRPDTFSVSALKNDEPRIVIPLFFNKRLIGVQGRSVFPDAIKYITVKFSENDPKIYGYDNINKSLEVYVLEGPFDSLFIPNSIAMCGADVNLTDLGILKPIYVYDNEPRNKDIHKRMLRVIHNQIPIVIWPSVIKQKDINQMIMSDLDVNKIIKQNTFSGLQANLQFNFWKKK